MRYEIEKQAFLWLTTGPLGVHELCLLPVRREISDLEGFYRSANDHHPYRRRAVHGDIILELEGSEDKDENRTVCERGMQRVGSWE